MNNQEEIKNEETQQQDETCKEENEEIKTESEEVTAEENAEEKKDEKKKGFFSKKNENEELKKRIIELEEENGKLKNEYLKAHADMENTRKRLSHEAEQIRKYRIQSFALDILPVIDNLERALAIAPTEETESYRKGVEMIYQQLLHALEKEGVTEVEALNKEFDPNYHQALMMEKVEGVEPNIVTEVLQKGYMLKDRILRAAMVKVSE